MYTSRNSCGAYSGPKHVDHRRLHRRPLLRPEVAFDDGRLLAVLGILQHRLVQLLEAVVRDRGKHVVRQVIILAHRKHGEIDERMAQKHAAVGEPAAVAVAVLHDLPQHHEQRERRAQRQHPQQEEVRRPPIAGAPRRPRQAQNISGEET